MDLDEEAITSVMVDKLQTYEDPFSAPEIEGLLSKDVVEEVPKVGDHKDMFAGVEHEKIHPQHSLKLKGATRCNLKLRVLARSLPQPQRSRRLALFFRRVMFYLRPLFPGSTSSSVIILG